MLPSNYGSWPRLAPNYKSVQEGGKFQQNRTHGEWKAMGGLKHNYKKGDGIEEKTELEIFQERHVPCWAIWHVSRPICCSLSFFS